MGCFFSNILGGFIRWGVGIILTAVCLMFGFSPESWIKEFITAPPTWLTHELTRVAFVLVGVVIIVGVFFWDRAIRHRAPLASSDADVIRAQAELAKQKRLQHKQDQRERVFISAKDSIGTKIKGSTFIGDRKHIDADGSAGLETENNVHLQSEFREWDLVDNFTVAQASCLWCGTQPGMSYLYQKGQEPRIGAIEQMIVTEAQAGRVKLDSSKNALAIIGDYAQSHVSRNDLLEIAKRKNQKPKFLFPEER